MKRVLIALLLCSSAVAQTGTSIPNFPTAPSISGTGFLILSQSGTTFKTTVNALDTAFDNDTKFTAGTNLALTGTTFSLNITTPIAATSVSGTSLTLAGAAAIYQPLDSDLTAVAGVTTNEYGRLLLRLIDAGELAEELDGQTLDLSELLLGGQQLSALFQPLDADLTSLAGASSTGALYYRSASNTWSTVTIGSGLSFSTGTLSATGGSGSGYVAGSGLTLTGTTFSLTEPVNATNAYVLLDSVTEAEELFITDGALTIASPALWRTALGLDIGVDVLAPGGNGSALTGLTASQVSLDNVNNTAISGALRINGITLGNYAGAGQMTTATGTNVVIAGGTGIAVATSGTTVTINNTGVLASTGTSTAGGLTLTRTLTNGTNAFVLSGTAQVVSSIGITIDGGGSAISTGVKGYISVPYAATINSVTMLADQSGSAVVDLWKDTYANYPPVVGDTITASAKPTITAATKSTDATLTGWTTSITAGDVIAFNVDSASTITRLHLILKVTK